MNIYDRSTTDFNNNGYGFLRDAISSKVTEVLNGELSLTIEYPLDGHLNQYLLKENIIKCNVGNDNYQLFRIKYIKQTATRITIYAMHVFYDLADNMLVNVAPTDLSCQSAIEWMLARTQYANTFTAYSDIVTTASARYVRRSPIEALIGDIDNSIIVKYGSELERDNYLIKMLSRRGDDNNVKVLFGKNISEIEITEDASTIYTRIMPLGANGITLPEEFIDSPLISNYIAPKIAKIEFEDIVYDPNDPNAYQTLDDAYEEMRTRTAELYSVYNYDKPKISVNVSWIELSKVKEYYNKYSALETVSLGDTITAEYKGFLYTTRIVKTIYNVLLDKIESFEMGIVKPSYTTTIDSRIDTITNTLENPTNILAQAKEDATSLIKSAMGGYVYKTQNELFIMDTADPDTAVKVWRWNLNGLGYSETGVNGTYETAMTSDGQIVADFITTGNMSVSRITGLYDSLTSIELNMHNITSSIKQTGGANLIKDSLWLFGGGLWNKQGTGNVSGGYSQELVGKTVSASRISIHNDKITTRPENIINLIIGQRYSLSYKISNDEDAITKIKMLSKNNIIYEQTIDTIETLKSFNYSFIASNDKLVLEISSTATYEGTALISDLMLNQGEVRVWELAKDEVFGTSMQTSSAGTIFKNTSSNTATLIGSDGTEVREYNSGIIGTRITALDKNGVSTTKLQADELKQKNLIKKVIKNSDDIDVYITYMEG